MMICVYLITQTLAKCGLLFFINRNFSTAGDRSPSFFQIFLSCAFCVKFLPAVVLISSAYLFIGLPNILLFSQSLHFNALDVHLLLFIPATCPANYLFNLAILLLIGVILIILLISSFLIRSLKLTPNICYSIAHCMNCRRCGMFFYQARCFQPVNIYKHAVIVYFPF